MPAGSWVAFCAVVLAAISALLALKKKTGLWLATFAASTVLGFWFYGTARLPTQPTSDQLALPPREALVEFEIQRVMQAENTYGNSTGVARVIDASPTSRLKKGSLIYFRLSRDDTTRLNIIRGLAIQVIGVLHPIPEEAVPDSFDAYLQETGIHYRFEQTGGVRLLREPTAFQKFCHHTNKKFQDHLRLGEPDASQLSQIYIAMLLGEKTELSDEQTDRFRMTGTMHLFAISGLHIGVIATVIWQVLLLFRLPSKVRPLIGLPLLYFYVEITGGAPSAVRAFLMVTFFWVSMAVQRQRSPLSALAASAVLVLIIQPLQLWQMGFQLSYLVVISILLFGLPLREVLWPVLRPNKFVPESNWSTYAKIKFWVMDKLLLLVVISFAAWLASAPLSAGFFGFIAPYSVIVNILLVNLAALVISGGVISLTVASLGLGGLAGFLNHSAWVGISIMDGLVRMNLTLPWAIIHCPEFPTIVSYLCVLCFMASIILIGNKHSPLLRFAVPPLVVIFALTLGLLWGSA
ncbi:ComEC/Rec2 family competence protein [Coraliomargarita sinensis]|nr:ComEC/Rec2 family competence protein [Coraliomargarita sinensis]